jgi:hypothetical protein
MFCTLPDAVYHYVLVANALFVLTQIQSPALLALEEILHLLLQ